jgi:hypothetical protein
VNAPFEGFDSLQELQEALRVGLEPRATVQVVVMTINGHKVVCLGPTLHAPHLGLHVGEVQEIEFGEIIPAHLAVRLLDGSLAGGTMQ